MQNVFKPILTHYWLVKKDAWSITLVFRPYLKYKRNKETLFVLSSLLIVLLHKYMLMTFFFLDLIWSVIFSMSPSIAGTAGWDKDPVTGNQYQRNEMSVLNWYQARKSCQQQGADLLSIVELHEQSYISGTELAANRCSLTLLPRWNHSW